LAPDRSISIKVLYIWFVHLKLFVIISQGESSKAAETLYVQSATVNPDGSLSVQIDNIVRHFTAKEWDGVSVIKHPNRVTSLVN
jgi:hypothetical protein